MRFPAILRNRSKPSLACRRPLFSFSTLLSVAATVIISSVKNARIRVLYRLKPTSALPAAALDLQGDVASPVRVKRDASQTPSAMSLLLQSSAVAGSEVIAASNALTPS